MQFLKSSTASLAAALSLLVLSGCSPEAKKAKSLAQAERSFAAGNYDQAEIGYKNVLAVDKLDPQAIERLASIYTDQGTLGRAVIFVLKAREQQPDNLDLRLKYARLSLALGSRKEAEENANFVLERRPLDPEAPLLLIGTVARKQDAERIKARLEALPDAARNSPAVLTALALIDFNLGRTDEAEALARRALASDEKFAAARAVLGSLYWMRKDTAAAEKEFKLAADYSPLRSQRRIQYAQFKIQTGDVDAAKRYLDDITHTAPDFVLAWNVLADLALSQKNYDECARCLAKTTARDPVNLQALTVRSRLHLAQGNATQAVELLQRLTAADPRSPQLQHLLATAYLAGNDAVKATVSLRQALALAPGWVEPTLTLASLHLRAGDPTAAIVLLKPLAQKRPELAQARLLLAAAYRSQRNFDDAHRAYEQLERDFPGNPESPLWQGLIWLEQKQLPKARQALELALVRSPGLLPALERLVAMDLDEGRAPAARTRIDAELVRTPQSAGLHALSARLCMHQSDTAGAELALKKAIELQPDGTEPYFRLAQLYLSTQRDKEALTSLRALVSRNAKDTQSLMLIAQICSQQRDYPAARVAYEQLIEADPKQANALNNLACLYSEQLNDLEKASSLAQKARELLPQNPHVSDTLGWILVKKGQPRWALNILEESSAKLPEDAEILYHLGVARYLMGKDEPAQIALQQALVISSDLPGSDDARRRLAILAIDPRTAEATARALIQQTLSLRPDDPIALARLASVQERDGLRAQAITTLEKAVKANPEVAASLLHLARLYAAEKDVPKALEAAKTARKVEPDNPDTSRILGGLAYELGDFEWAASLFHDAARKMPDDASLRYQEGTALYSIGRLPEACNAMRDALEIAERADAENRPAAFPNQQQAKVFLELAAVFSNPTPSAMKRVEQVLNADPESVPALVAFARLSESSGMNSVAKASYEKALVRFPSFAPAKLRLAILAASQPTFDEKAYDGGTQARSVFPDDADLARALGILSYRKGGEPLRALSYLKQSASQFPNDPEVLYFVGMAQLDAKDPATGRRSLQKALDLGLRDELAQDARKALGSIK